MGRIGFCEVCGATEQRRAAEIYDGIDNAPNACWQCERALKFEQERIIKLLEEVYGWQWEHGWIETDLSNVIALIKGEK